MLASVLPVAASASQAFTPADQAYLDEARQMQALSFAAHIPLVCFGIAFPAMVLFVEWLHLRTGDPVYRVLARRWSKVMLALFAIGVWLLTLVLAYAQERAGQRGPAEVLLRRLVYGARPAR